MRWPKSCLLYTSIPDIKGKQICLLNKNSYEYAVNTFGIILAGGVLVLLNQHKSWDELSYEMCIRDRCGSSGQ